MTVITKPTATTAIAPASGGVATGDLLLKPGSVVDAQVIAARANLVKIVISGMVIEALSEVQLQPGTAVKLAVTQTVDGIRLAIVDKAPADQTGRAAAPTQASAATSPQTNVTTSSAPRIFAPSIQPDQAPVGATSIDPKQALQAAVVTQAVRAAAPVQASLSSLFANLPVVVSSAATPPDVKAVAAQLLAARPALTETLEANDIRDAFKSSGVLLEASVAKGVAPTGTPDLKAALVVFRQLLSSWAAVAPSAPASLPSDVPASPQAAGDPAIAKTPLQAAAAVKEAVTITISTPLRPVTPPATTTQAAPSVATDRTPVATNDETASLAPTVIKTDLPQTASAAPESAQAEAEAPEAPLLRTHVSTAAQGNDTQIKADGQAKDTGERVRSPATSGASPAPAGAENAPARPATTSQTSDRAGDPQRPGVPALPKDIMAGNEQVAVKPAAVPFPSPRITAESTPPAPPVRGATPSVQPIVPPSIEPDMPASTVVSHLIDQTDGAIARQTLLQVASLPERFDTASASQPQQRWAFEIPFATPQGTAVAQFEISDETGGGLSGGGSLKRVWRARFTLDIETTGPVHALVSLAGDKTSVRMWAERPDTALRLHDNAQALDSALRLADLEPGDIVVQGGQPPQAKPARAGHFLDRAT